MIVDHCAFITTRVYEFYNVYNDKVMNMVLDREIKSLNSEIKKAVEETHAS
jgi:hypothetical protein